VSIFPPSVPQQAFELVNQQGCRVSFDEETTISAPAYAVINGAQTAIVIVNTTACQIKFYGELPLDNPIRGAWLVSYSEAATLALQAEADRPLIPLERGRGVFMSLCSACHGVYGEGAPGIPSLDTDEVRRLTDQQLLDTIRFGRPNTVMVAWGNVLSEEDIAALLVLVRNIGSLSR
jgi:mono/diheme cytochrome c family protein